MIELSRPLRPLVLVIADGWGLAPKGLGNAIARAKTSFYDSLLKDFPSSQLQASGEAVGLPKEDVGNSEVGHLNLGAGRIVLQDLSKINQAVEDGSFLKNKSFLKAFQHVKENHSNLHIMGLAGNGTVHSRIDHLLPLLQAAKDNDVEKAYLHLFTDGRDSSPTAAKDLIPEIIRKCKQLGIGTLSSLVGRYWAMDRDNHWERIERAYELLVNGDGYGTADPESFIERSYEHGTTDEFLEPVLVLNKEGKGQIIKDNDSLIFFNFRPDRGRELAKAFVLSDLTKFNRGPKLKNLLFVTMTQFEEGLPVEVAFPFEEIRQPLAEVVSKVNLKQMHVSETEKYAHVTYFLNGGREEPFAGEERKHIPSPRVATYDLKPEMSALEIANFVVSELEKGENDFYAINFANADMVGHTGSISATVEAVEVLDKCLEQIVNKTLEKGGGVVITADHGNAEVMLTPEGKVDTAHNPSPVPLIIVANELKNSGDSLNDGILADVAPTILKLMGLEKPAVMTGKDLLKEG